MSGLLSVLSASPQACWEFISSAGCELSTRKPELNFDVLKIPHVYVPIWFGGRRNNGGEGSDAENNTSACAVEEMWSFPAVF